MQFYNTLTRTKEEFTPKQMQELDQVTAKYVDLITPSLKRLYDNLIESGVPKEVAAQALSRAASDLFMSFLGIKRE
jgi:thymidylate synthase ThyX